MTTPRGMKTTVKTWSRHISFLISIINGSQGRLPHQHMYLNFLRRARKITIIEIRTIGKSDICHECGKKGHIRPNCPNKKEINTITNKTPKSTRRRHTKNIQKEQRKSGRILLKFHNTQIIKQATMMITHLRNFVSSMSEAGMGQTLETCCYWITNTWLNYYATRLLSQEYGKQMSP